MKYCVILYKMEKCYEYFIPIEKIKLKMKKAVYFIPRVIYLQTEKPISH